MALGELPYSNIELEQTAAFLAKAETTPPAFPVRRRHRGLLRRAAEALRGLSAGASALSARVAGLQSDLMGGAVTLEDLEAAEARLSAAEGGGHTLADSSYQTVESDFPELPSLIYDGPFSEHIAGRTPAMLEGREDVTQDEARLAAARFLDLKPELFTLVSAGSGRLPTYSFSAMVGRREAVMWRSPAGWPGGGTAPFQAGGVRGALPEEAVAAPQRFFDQPWVSQYDGKLLHRPGQRAHHQLGRPAGRRSSVIPTW